MKLIPLFCAAALLAAQDELKLVVVDPVHFHASLLQKEMYPGVASRVSVYAPVGPEVADYLNRIALFNARKDSPTSWQLDLRLSSDYFDRLLRDRPGNVIVMSGHNRGKINRIQAAVGAGFHLLADKPWIISSADMDRLEAALNQAERNGRAAYDIMTERYEISTILQREFVNDPAVFGKLEPGTANNPGISAKSIHYISKVVAGVPLRRPVWFFDVDEYGEGLADVGTHVVDLVQWTAFPEALLDYRSDIRILAGKHWPTTIDKEQFRRVTGEADYPASFSKFIREGKLDYYANNFVHYTLRGVHVKLDILWGWEAQEGGDVYEAVYRGSKARVEIRQGKEEKFVPEVYIVPNSPSSREAIFAAARQRIQALQKTWPGLSAEPRGDQLRLVIPPAFRVGHEAHFAQVTKRFFQFLRDPKSLPAWEKHFMLAKYYVSTRGVEFARTK